jgi:predicted outer membrane repeat protein
MMRILRIRTDESARPPRRAHALGFSLACLLLTASAAAEIPLCGNCAIEEVTLSANYWPVWVGRADTTYAYRYGAIYRSVDHGMAWTNVYDSAHSWVGCTGLFVTSTGRVCVGIANTGTMPVLCGDGQGALKVDATLTFHCGSTSPRATMTKMTEDAAGNLYVGEYGGELWHGTSGDTCAYTWKSTDGGSTWNTVYDSRDARPARHIHFVWADPSSGYVYATQGDGTAVSRMIRSTDGGATWASIRSDTCDAQYLSIAATGSRRMLGTDNGSPASANRFVSTEDDSTFTTVATLEGTQNAFVWAMSSSPDGRIFAGTVCRETGWDGRAGLYASFDGGDSFVLVRDFGRQPPFRGIDGLSNFDSQGFGYYHPNISGRRTVRFAVSRRYTIGDAGDFATVAAALADSRVGRGDTLAFLPGHHRVSGARPYRNMVWMGTTGDPRNHVIINDSTVESAVIADSTDLRFTGLQFRTLASTAFTETDRAMIESTRDRATVTFEHCEWRNCDATATGGEGGLHMDYPHEREASARFVSCVFDSCSTVRAKAPGIGYFGNVARLIFNGCEVSRTSGGSAPLVLDYGHIDDVVCKVLNSTFSENTSLGRGGALSASVSDMDATIDTMLVERCTFERNTSSFGGAADWPQGRFHDCEFRGNHANAAGGAIWREGLGDGSLVVTGCTFSGNTAPSGGAVFARSLGAVEIAGCTFEDNVADEMGGALLCEGVPDSVGITHTSFLRNTARSGGGVCSISAPSLSAPSLSNCTFAGNEATDSGGALFCQESGLKVTNSIIAFNGPENAVSCDGIDDPSITRCCVWSNGGGDSTCVSREENLVADPLFCDAALGDLTLAQASQCLPENNTWGELIGACGPGACSTGIPDLPQDGGDFVFALEPANPNPFRSTTSVAFSIPEAASVSIDLFGVAGRLVRTLVHDERFSAGRHVVTWDGRDDSGDPLASGVYFCRAAAGGRRLERGMVLLRE